MSACRKDRIGAHALKIAAFCIVFVFARASGASFAETNEYPSPKSTAGSNDAEEIARKLIKAYPGYFSGIEGNFLVWKDGAKMIFDDGIANKDFATLLEHPDIKDQFIQKYTVGPLGSPPSENFDPGRFRNEDFFAKMYGDCEKGEVKPKLVTIDWLPKKGGGKLKVTSVNKINEKLKAVSDELDNLPVKFDKDLIPAAGIYNCRDIAGTNLHSMHSYGAAIDISVAEADYWKWSSPDVNGYYQYKNRIPFEIVDIFEKHGFIWGGKWYHFDTMHFEYRPELLPDSR